MTLSDGPMGPFRVGDRIFERFEVRGLLGRGGHAFVYDCYNFYLDEPVAIKVIPASPHRGKQLFERARREAQMLYRLNHSNVVRVVEGGDIQGMAVMVMEKLEGMNLREYLAICGPLTVLEALTIAVQIAAALDAAHGMQVIHRDLKPENIFVLIAKSGAPGSLLGIKVLDFGIAKFLEAGYQTTQRELIQGTAPYMSPEHAQGFGVTFASDIFQLGTLIYEMIAGICPCFVGTEEPTAQVILAIQISKMPKRLKALVPNVPEDLDELVWQALAKNPQQRQPSMAVLRLALESELRLLRAELPPEQRVVRVLRANTPTTSSPHQPGGHTKSKAAAIVLEVDRTASSELLGVVEPAATMTADPMPATRATSNPQLGMGRPEARAIKAPTVRSDLSSAPLTRAVDPFSARNASLRRRTLLRALLIGAAVSVPASVVAFKIFVRPGLHAPVSASAVAPATQSEPAAKPSAAPTPSVTVIAEPAASAPTLPAAAPPAPLPGVVQRAHPNSAPSARKVATVAPAGSHSAERGIFKDDLLFPPRPDDDVWLDAKPNATAPQAPKKAAKATKPAPPPAPTKIPKLIF